MAHPLHHAESSARRYGGVPEDYRAVHSWFDASKSHLALFTHRALRHHSQGIFEAETVFGLTITNSAGRVIPTRWIGEQHVKEDCRGRIPSLADWLTRTTPAPWMANGAIDTTKPDALRDPQSAWRHAVGEGQTVLGYRDWCAKQETEAIGLDPARKKPHQLQACPLFVPPLGRLFCAHSAGDKVMLEPIHTEIYRDHRIKIFHDTDPENPRDLETFTTMTCWHRRYRLGDPHTFETPHDFLVNLAGISSETDLGMDAMLARARRQAIILPLYLYDHSGITMNTIGFHCPWDSGQVGFIHVTRAAARRAYGVKRLSPQRSDQIEKLLIQDVVTYDAYLTGNCFGLTIEKDGEEIDSCWGFLGHYQTHCLSEARASVDAVFGT